MNMRDMIEEAQEICERARAFITTEDYMEAAYKLCDLQVLLVRMEYEAKRDDVVITQVDGTTYRIPSEPGRAPEIGYVYSGQTTASEDPNPTAVEPRFDNQPNPTPTVTQDPAQTHIDVPAECGTERGEVDMEPTITDLRDEEIPHTSEVTSGSRFTLGGILGRH